MAGSQPLPHSSIQGRGNNSGLKSLGLRGCMKRADSLMLTSLGMLMDEHMGGRRGLLRYDRNTWGST